MIGAAPPRAGREGCPKWMVHGPCGGVQADGSCEVGGPCPFVIGGAPAGLDASSVVDRPERGAAGAELLALMDRRALIVADLPSPGPDPRAERELAAAVAGSVDVVLLGDAPWARVQLPPSLRAGIVAGEGVRPWAGMNCRDRNRVALAAELAALAGTGMPAVHCVTGDHPALGHRPDAPAVFDLDSTELARLAATKSGLLVSVAESPESPPVGSRVARAAAKARAGADVLFINHCSSVSVVAEFAAQVRELAPELRLIACVPLVVSQAGADRLAAFLHGPLPTALSDPLRDADPVRAGIAACLGHAEALLGLSEIDGVDLSAPAGPGESMLIAGALAQAGRALGGGAR